MNYFLVIFGVITLTLLLFSGSTGILPKGDASINNVLPENFLELNEPNMFDDKIANSQLMQAGQFFIEGLSNGVIEGERLEANGLDEKLLEGIETNQLIETTQNLMNDLSNGEIDQQWVEKSLTSDNGGGGGGYAAGFVLILVLFILLVIIGAGFGL